MEAKIELEIKEKDLELIISNKTLGSLTTNAKDIKALIEKSLPNYDIKNYSANNIDDAKKDKAMLNNASKVLNAKRIEIEKEFMKPFSEFKEIVTDTVKLISDCSSKIDVVVKNSEQKEKDNKKVEIQKYFDSKDFKLITLDKIFDEKWLNKTSKIKDIHFEIDAKIAEINDGLSTLEVIGEDVETLKAMYLDNLNINETIKYSNTLKQNKVKLQPKAVGNSVEVTEPIKEEVSEVSVSINVPVSTPANTTRLLIRTMRVTTTLENLIALGNFMNDNGISFEKLA